MQRGAGEGEQEIRMCMGDGFADEKDDARMREEMQLEMGGCTYDAFASHVACDKGKLCLSSRTCSCRFAISREYADCKGRLTRRSRYVVL